MYILQRLLLQIRERPHIVARALISTRVVVQVKLVVLLRIIPLACRQDLRHDAALPPLVVGLFRYVFRLLLLLLIVVEYARAILRTPVSALAVRSGRIMHLVEVLYECAVGDLLRVEDDLAGFGV